MQRNSKSSPLWGAIMLIAALAGAGLACGHMPQVDLNTFVVGNAPESVAQRLSESAAQAQEGAIVVQQTADADGLATVELGGGVTHVSLGALREPGRALGGLTVQAVEVGGAVVVQSGSTTGYLPATTVVGSAGRDPVALLVDDQPGLDVHNTEIIPPDTSALPLVGAMTPKELMGGLAHSAGTDEARHFTLIAALNEGPLPEQIAVYATPLPDTFLVTPAPASAAEAGNETITPTVPATPRAIVARANLPELEGEQPPLLTALENALAAGLISTVPVFEPYTWQHIQRYVDWYYAAPVEVQKEVCLSGSPEEIVRMAPQVGTSWYGDTPLQLWVCQSPAAPGPIEFGQTVVGYFAEGDTEGQTWTFAADKYDSVTVAISSGEGLTPRLTIRTAGGRFVADSASTGKGGGPAASLEQIILGEAASYEIVVNPDAGFGFYELSLQYLGQIEVGGGRIAYGDSRTVILAVPDEPDEWTFEGSAGDQITIRMTASDIEELDPTLTLLGPDGTEVAWSDDYEELNPFIEVTLYQDGDYTIQAGAYSGAGEYEIELELVRQVDLPGTGGGPITYAEIVEALLTPAENRQEWTFEGVEGQLVSIAMNDRSGTIDAFLELYDPDGNLLAEADYGGGANDARIALFELPVDGTYTIVATSYDGDDVGVYELGLFLPENPGGGRLAIGQTVEETLADDDVEHLWTFNATGGQILEIAMEPLEPTLVPLLQLYSPEGALIREGIGTSDRGNQARLVIIAPTTGTYRLIASSESHADTGAYKLTVQPFTLGTGDVQVTLRWDSVADLDLSVIAPDGEEISFANPVGASGGIFDIDSNYPCEAAITEPLENIYWPTGSGLTGTYQVIVRFFSACGGPTTVDFTLTITVDGVTETIEGTVDVDGVYEFEFER